MEYHQIWKSKIIWGDIVSGIPPYMEVKDHLRRYCRWNPTRYGGQVSFTWHCQWNPTRYEGQGSFMWNCPWNPTRYGGQGAFEVTLSVESHQICRSGIIWGDIVSGNPPDMQVRDHLGDIIPQDMEVKDHLRGHCQWNPTRYGGHGSFTWHCHCNPTIYGGQWSFRWHCQWNPTRYGGQGSFQVTLSVESHHICSRIIWRDIVSGIPPDMEVKVHLGDIFSAIPPNMEVKNHFRGHCQWNSTRYGGQESFRWHYQWNPIRFAGHGSFEETLSVESHQIRRSSIIYVTLSMESHQIRRSRIIYVKLSMESHQIRRSRSIWGDIASGIPPDMQVRDNLRRHCQWKPTRYTGQGSFRWHYPTRYGGQGSFEGPLSVESHQIWRSGII